MTAATTISRPAAERPRRHLARVGGPAASDQYTRTARARVDSTRRPADRRLAADRRVVVGCSEPGSSAPSVAVERDVYFRRRAWAGAAVVGIGLMMLVLFLMFFGRVVESGAAPANTGTAVVHVQSGESLGDIASRIAPEMPTEAVVEKIMDLNAMSNSALSPGQSLVTPIYAR
ncbi:LysM peptidoglycan-binding domain-containing protein [Williamsia muralis]|uniref:LysM peptidoglycan-binding domain-containing protein n=1 Tax=Williamsia marianensis TaxID=85044 RepID=UPI000DE7760D|nr:LysM peptidoglycan-binding domain-containing protein [Williamsia marianensis]PVY32801.1 LysM domain-containing protein [Williamsia marianensis]